MRKKSSTPNRGFQGRRSDPARSDGADRARVEGPAGGHGDDPGGRGDARLRARQGVLQRADRRPARRCETALNQAAGFLRNGLFKRLHIHTVPTLHFLFDRTTERAADMNALIAKAVSSRAKRRLSHATRHAPGCNGALCMGCCCSTNRWACPATRPCRRPSGCCAPKRPATPARSIRWPPACCRCASARPPSSASCSSMPTRPTKPRCAWA